ncbi:putative chitobiose transport system substrate-binding protein [Chitinivorax tropicus]|uniref:Putative chitobiose transport system substrate-binding protein n=1 Tax=Chitinivorax tropicus TaxID=714531 RepID=A0A840MQ84_9PROT|nr:extracellular solute-binding protein [Chitinivorax tropicus]MBB5018626.1 putative chitobiose transport system substrate-binding protein [Chitinivorax tropicus]
MKMKHIALATLAACGLAMGSMAHAEKAKLEFWTMSLSPKFNGYFEDLVKKYNAQSADVEWVWVDYPWDVIQSKFTSAIAAGKPPALVNLNVPWAYDYFQDGLLQPVDALIKKDQYAAGAIADVTFNGKVYAFPHYNGANVIIYNKELFKKAGLDPNKPPRTTDEMFAAAKQIKAKTGVAGYAPAIGPTKIEGYFMQNGLDIVKDGKAAVNSPAHAAFIKKIADVYKAGGFMKDNLFSQDNFQASLAAFNQGRMAMLVSTPTTLTRIRDDAPDLYKKLDVAAAPVGPTGIVDGGWMFNFGVAKNVDAKYLAEIGKFGTYLTNTDNQLTFSKAAGTLPTSKAAALDPFFQQYEKDDLLKKGIATAAKNLDKTRTIYLANVKDSEQVSNRLASSVEKAVNGREDIQKALNDAAEFLDKKIVRK